MTRKKIYVTSPELPPLDEFTPYLKDIWQSKILTNSGPLCIQLELELAKYLGVEHVSLVTNGTLALDLVIKALNIKGSVITSPFTFVATANALILNGIKPIYADINKKDGNINVDSIEALITPDTTAILGVHCYGNTCDTAKINKIANKYGLKVIYDAAHCFGVRTVDQSHLTNCDYSIISLHATKLFNTLEGGLIISKNAAYKKNVNELRNFCFVGEDIVSGVGTNAKIDEMRSALGLCQIKYVDQNISARRRVYLRYAAGLPACCKILITGNHPNYSYIPIVMPSNTLRERIYSRLKSADIYARRYFYPLVSSLTDTSQNPAVETPEAHDLAERILCLPIYPTLEDYDIDRIVSIFNDLI